MARKTFSFAVMHFTVAFSVAYLMTGSVMVGGAIALVEPAVNTVAFYVHERLWQRLRPGTVDERPAGGPPETAARREATPYGWHAAC
jgi:uncharacterized membrane protein